MQYRRLKIVLIANTDLSLRVLRQKNSLRMYTGLCGLNIDVEKVLSIVFVKPKAKKKGKRNAK